MHLWVNFRDEAAAGVSLLSGIFRDFSRIGGIDASVVIRVDGCSWMKWILGERMLLKACLNYTNGFCVESIAEGFL